MSQLLEEPRWEVPPACTRPDGPWCESRFLRDGDKICRALRTCAKQPRAAPAPWTGVEVGVLEKNSHLDVYTLQYLLPARTREEIREKLQEVDP